MPHVIVKYFDAPISETNKAALAETITVALTEALGCASRAVSISLRPVAPVDWQESVFIPDISERRTELIKIPDYSGLDGPKTERKEL